MTSLAVFTQTIFPYPMIIILIRDSSLTVYMAIYYILYYYIYNLTRIALQCI